LIYKKIRFFLPPLIIALLLIACAKPEKPKPTTVQIQKKIPQTTAAERRRKQLESLFKDSHKLFQSIPLPTSADINWSTLTKLVNLYGAKNNYSKKNINNAHKIIRTLKQGRRNLKKSFHFKWNWQGLRVPDSSLFIKRGPVLGSIELFSMWDHCSLELQNHSFPLYFELKSAWQSPAYQALLLLKSANTLRVAFEKIPPPFFSAHQKLLPAITIKVKPHKNAKVNWKPFDQSCRQFGFVPTGTLSGRNQQEYLFIGVKKLYSKLLNSKRIPQELLDNLLDALYQGNFFPSVKGLETILALSEKESSFQWNPRVNRIKKKSLKKEFDSTIFDKKNGVSSYFVDLLLSKDLLKQKSDLIEDLEKITDIKNPHVTEFDIYLWSRKALDFIHGVMNRYDQSSKVGSFFFDLNTRLKHLEYEPQTFGLWQSNVNNLLQLLQQKKTKAKKYPEIFNKGKIDRHQLVRALSGLPDSMSHKKTLSLLFETTIKPAYYNHLQGEEDDLNYFASENLVGKMATYRATIQKKLNEFLKTNLTIDGDLAHYYPYSLQINWDRRSNSQLALYKFIFKNKETLLKGLDSSQLGEEADQLIREICQASTKEELFRSKLYRAIMKGEIGKRIYPKIASRLYGQTPEDYAEKVFKLASQYGQE